jgi:hypothetical protein
MSKTPKGKRVLQDHKQIGKKFIPPLLHLRNVQTVKWQLPILPELLWLAILNSTCGTQTGAELAVALASSASKFVPQKWFAPASAYDSLLSGQKTEVLEVLKQSNKLGAIQYALNDLLWLYPACPLAFLFPSGPTAPEDPKSAREAFKSVLEELYDRGGRAPMLMQANAFFIGLSVGPMRIASDISLPNFAEIEKYPTTTESRRAGSAIRAAMMGLFGPNYETASTWPQYFWNRGLEIEPCDFDLIEKQSIVE